MKLDDDHKSLSCEGRFRRRCSALVADTRRVTALENRKAPLR
jgi:hypothetical protein